MHDSPAFTAEADRLRSAPRVAELPESVTSVGLSYDSKALGFRQSCLCYLPRNAGTEPRRYPLLLLLHGFGGSRHDWGLRTRMLREIAGKEIIVVCPDGDNGWYTNAVGGGERREDDIMQDLLARIEAELPIAPYPARAIAGLSMGGYGAVKLALKLPGTFRVAVGHSAAFDAATRPDLSEIFGAESSDAGLRRFENPYWLAEQALSRPVTERPILVFDCGGDDPMVTQSRSFSDHLTYLGYGHTYREMRGHHTWPYWNRAFRAALPDILKGISPISEAGLCAAPRRANAQIGPVTDTNDPD